MPNPGHSDETLLETLRLVSEYGSVREAARMANNGAGINFETLKSRFYKARDKFGDGERSDRETIREIYRERQVPAECAADPAAVRVLSEDVKRANAAATGQSVSTLPDAP